LDIGVVIIGKGKPKCLQKNLPQFCLFHHKSLINLPGIGDKPPSPAKASDTIFTDYSELSNFDATTLGRGEQNGDLNVIRIY
jgi:hypothetical protein